MEPEVGITIGSGTDLTASIKDEVDENQLEEFEKLCDAVAEFEEDSFETKKKINQMDRGA